MQFNKMIFVVFLVFVGLSLWADDYSSYSINQLDELAHTCNSNSERHAIFQEIHSRLQAMTEEERNAFMEKRKLEMQEKFNSMSDAEKEAFKERRGKDGSPAPISEEEREAFKQKMQEKFNSMSEEEKEAFKQKMSGRHKRNDKAISE